VALFARQPNPIEVRQPLRFPDRAYHSRPAETRGGAVVPTVIRSLAPAGPTTQWAMLPPPLPQLWLNTELRFRVP
jgi:hypothetical protein